MPDITTTQIFSDGEKGITATKMNNIVAQSTIQTDFIANKPASSTLDPTDQILELKGAGTYARITGAQLSSSVAAQLALADATQNGMLRKVSGNIGDYVDGTNNCRVLNTFVSLSAATTLTNADSNKYVICSGGSWTLTLPAPANGLAYRLRNDMGITGTTGTITVQPTGGQIDGKASLGLLPQQECTILCDGTNWRTFELRREVILGTQDITSSQANGTILLPVGYRLFQLDFTGLKSVTDGQNFQALFSIDGGATWIGGTSYSWQYSYNSGPTTFQTAWANGLGYAFIGPQLNASVAYGQCSMKLYPGGPNPANYISDSGDYATAAATGQRWMMYGYCGPVSTPVNALQYRSASGNIAQSFLTVKGIV